MIYCGLFIIVTSVALSAPLHTLLSHHPVPAKPSVETQTHQSLCSAPCCRDGVRPALRLVRSSPAGALAPRSCEIETLLKMYRLQNLNYFFTLFRCQTLSYFWFLIFTASFRVSLDDFYQDFW